MAIGLAVMSFDVLRMWELDLLPTVGRCGTEFERKEAVLAPVAVAGRRLERPMDLGSAVKGVVCA